MKPGDIINYPSKDKDKMGVGKIIDPKEQGLKPEEYKYYQSIGMVLIEAIINGKAGYWFWSRTKNLSIVNNMFPDDIWDRIHNVMRVLIVILVVAGVYYLGSKLKH